MPAGAPPQHSPVWPLWTRPSPTPRRRFPILPKTRKSVGSHRHHVPVFHAVSVPHTGGRPPYTSGPPYASAAFHKFTKNKPASPRFAGHTAAHAWPLPTRLGSPILLPSPKNPDLDSGETSVRRHLRARLHGRAHTFTRMRTPARPWRAKPRRDQRSGLHKPTRPASLLKSPAPTRGAWVWRQRRRGIRGGRCMLWSGLKPDRQSGLKSRRPARQMAGLKVPYPGNPYF